ncbi:MAG TPA: type I-B CRISPR-associated protein Cas7/Cst2/DevR, partial [Dehalococcoidia bacterium]|nr:type I-B CRISPR-associated protein Cas7/Cst2/DevR [Dehalococcoidia bacterium]
MAFLAGLMLLDAPAAALNNAGASGSDRTDNIVNTKSIRVPRLGVFPYVSAQAFRYWLRTTLERSDDIEWHSAPVYREAKVAYTDANPMKWWDDDLFGYMRAESTRTAAAARRRDDANRAGETPASVGLILTRLSPFRVGTFVAMAPGGVTDDFGTMSRHDGDPVPYQHQFYRTILKGLFSLDLHAAGTFSYRSRTGYRNLDENRRGEAERDGLEHLSDEQSYRLSLPKRIERIAALLGGIGVLAGGAKLALHYTDVVPAVILAAVMKGGNDPLNYAIEADERGQPVVNTEAVEELLRVWGDQMQSP